MYTARTHLAVECAVHDSHLEGGTGPRIRQHRSAEDEFVERGMDTPETLGKWIYENARVPARLYWDHVPLSNVARGLVANGVEPYASYSKLPPDALIPPFMPMQVEVVVTGGSTNGSWNVFSATSMARQTKLPHDVLFREAARLVGRALMEGP